MHCECGEGGERVGGEACMGKLGTCEGAKGVLDFGVDVSDADRGFGLDGPLHDSSRHGFSLRKQW